MFVLCTNLENLLLFRRTQQHELEEERACGNESRWY